MISIHLVILAGLLAAFVFAANLVQNPKLAFMQLGAAVLVLTVQYHLYLAVVIPVLTYQSAFIIGFLPGRPFIWEVVPLLGVSGLASSIAFRKRPLNYSTRNIGTVLGLVGIIGYCCVLLFVMHQRGFGLRIMGGDGQGGRAYIRQLLSAVFPFVFLYHSFERKTFLKLFIWGQLLSATYLIPDLLLQFHLSKPLSWSLMLFDFPTDSLNFFRQATGGLLHRFQSFGFFSFGLLTVLLVLKKPLDLFRQPWLIVAICLSLVMGMMSGTRSIMVYELFMIILWLWGHKVYRHPLLCIAGILVATIGIILLYTSAPRLPRAIQRSVAFLPGLHVDAFVSKDASGTVAMRRELRRIGMEMIPEYYWIGAGFSYPPVTHVTRMIDPTGVTEHLQRRSFYNGLIGLMINTGFPGTFFMVVFLLGGSVTAVCLIRAFIRSNSHDAVSRAGFISAGLWLAEVGFFLFLHGDSESAMKRFAYRFAVLLVFRHLDMAQSRESQVPCKEESSLQPGPEFNVQGQ